MAKKDLPYALLIIERPRGIEKIARAIVNSGNYQLAIFGPRTSQYLSKRGVKHKMVGRKKLLDILLDEELGLALFNSSTTGTKPGSANRKSAFAQCATLIVHAMATQSAETSAVVMPEDYARVADEIETGGITLRTTEMLFHKERKRLGHHGKIDFPRTSLKGKKVIILPHVHAEA